MKNLQKRFLSVIMAFVITCLCPAAAFAAENANTDMAIGSITSRRDVSVQSDVHTIWAPGIMLQNGFSINNAYVKGNEAVYFIGVTNNTSLTFTFIHKDTHASYNFYNVSTNGKTEVKLLTNGMPGGSYVITVTPTNPNNGSYAFELAQ